MPNCNNPPPPGGMEQATLRKYYPVVENPSEKKRQGETPKIDKVNTFLDNTNDNNDNTTISINSDSNIK